MTNILLIIGSARKGRVADAVANYIQNTANEYDATTISVADLAKLNLPYYNNEHSPKDPAFHEDNEQVHTWSQLVRDADAVIFLTPEYNHSLTGIQKNAIDWLYDEWVDKPTGVVAYGFYGGANALVTFKEVAKTVRLDVKAEPAQLYFNTDIATDGSVIDEAGVHEKIRGVLESLR